MPIVSVVIPTYNRADFLMQAIKSVRTQSFTDYELIVVDDGSTDHTIALLEPLIERKEIRYVFQQNQGESAARNTGVRMAQGKYIAFLDSDDLFMPEKLEKQVVCLETALDIGIVHSGYSKFDDAGNDLGYRDTSHLSGWVYPQILLEWSVLIAVPAVMVRSSVLAEVGGFDEIMIHAPDLDLWRRIAMHYRFGVIPEMLSKVRKHPGNVSRHLTKTADGFEFYLKKAFNDDPSLSPSLKRKAMARMYTNVGLSLLADGNLTEMGIARQCSFQSIFQWPFYPRAYATIIFSFLGKGIRGRLARSWRKYRDKPYQQKH